MRHRTGLRLRLGWLKRLLRYLLPAYFESRRWCSLLLRRSKLLPLELLLLHSLLLLLLLPHLLLLLFL